MIVVSEAFFPSHGKKLPYFLAKSLHVLYILWLSGMACRCKISQSGSRMPEVRRLWWPLQNLHFVLLQPPKDQLGLLFLIMLESPSAPQDQGRWMQIFLLNFMLICWMYVAINVDLIPCDATAHTHTSKQQMLQGWCASLCSLCWLLYKYGVYDCDHKILLWSYHSKWFCCFEASLGTVLVIASRLCSGQLHHAAQFCSNILLCLLKQPRYFASAKYFSKTCLIFLSIPNHFPGNCVRHPSWSTWPDQDLVLIEPYFSTSWSAFEQYLLAFSNIWIYFYILSPDLQSWTTFPRSSFDSSFTFALLH